MNGTSIQQFQHEQFGIIRTTVDENGNPLFCAKDVAVALGYNNTNDAIKRHCKGVAFHYPLETAGGTQNARFITEGDMYRLIASSKLDSAVKFESWVFDDVLPTIRKTGSYSVPESDDDLLARALIVAQDRVKAIEGRAAELETENAEQREMIAVMRPKALFADAVAISDTDIPVGDLAKILKRNGFDVGRNRLFETLRNDGFLMNQDSSRNMPTQKATNMKLLVLREDVLMTAKGTSYIRRMTMVTPYGQIYFVKRYCFVQRQEESGQLALELVM